MKKIILFVVLAGMVKIAVSVPVSSQTDSLLIAYCFQDTLKIVNLKLPAHTYTFEKDSVSGIVEIQDSSYKNWHDYVLLDTGIVITATSKYKFMEGKSVTIEFMATPKNVYRNQVVSIKMQDTISRADTFGNIKLCFCFRHFNLPAYINVNLVDEHFVIQKDLAQGTILAQRRKFMPNINRFKRDSKYAYMSVVDVGKDYAYLKYQEVKVTGILSGRMHFEQIIELEKK